MVVFQTIIELIPVRPYPTLDWYITVVRLTEVDREQTSVWNNFLSKYITVIENVVLHTVSLFLDWLSGAVSVAYEVRIDTDE
jgi:hypothetical protein